MRGWYVEFLKAKWNSKKFNERVSEMVLIKTFGERIDIATWFEAEAVYTPAQVTMMIDRKVNSMILEGDRLLKGQELEIEVPAAYTNLDSIKLAISKQIKCYHDSECVELSEQVFEDIFPEVLERLNLKKVVHNNIRYAVGSKLKMKLGYS